MSRHKKVVWLNMGPVIVHFGFCGSERAYKGALKHCGITDAGEFIPSGAGACVHVFESTERALMLLLCYDAKNATKKRRGQVDALMAHECAHVAQHCMDYMRETPAARETFAYIVQYAFGFVSERLWGQE